MAAVRLSKFVVKLLLQNFQWLNKTTLSYFTFTMLLFDNFTSCQRVSQHTYGKILISLESAAWRDCSLRSKL